MGSVPVFSAAVSARIICARSLLSRNSASDSGVSFHSVSAGAGRALRDTATTTTINSTHANDAICFMELLLRPSGQPREQQVKKLVRVGFHSHTAIRSELAFWGFVDRSHGIQRR